MNQSGGSVTWEFDVNNGKLMAGLDQAESSVANVASSINKIGQNMVSSVGSSFSALGKVVENSLTSAATAAVGALVQLGTRGIQTGAYMQSLQLQMNGLTKSTELGAKAMMIAADFWQNNPFQRADVAATTKTLLAMGRGLNDIADDLKILGNISVTTGADLQSLGTVFAGISSSGRIMGGQIFQLTQMGVSILPALQKELGKTADEVREMASDGEVSFETFKKALSTIVDPSIIAQMENTLPRQLDRLGGALTTVATAFVGSTQTIENGYVATANGLLQASTNLIRQITESLKMPEVEAAAMSAGEALTPFVQKIADLFVTMEGGVATAGPIANIIEGFFNFIAKLGPAIIPILVALSFRLSSLFSQIPVVGELIAGIGGSFNNLSRAMANTVSVGISGFVEGMAVGFRNLVPAIQAASTIFGGAAGKIREFVSAAMQSDQARVVLSNLKGAIGDIGFIAYETVPGVGLITDAVRNMSTSVGATFEGMRGRVQMFADSFSQAHPRIASALGTAKNVAQSSMGGIVSVVASNVGKVGQVLGSGLSAAVDVGAKALSTGASIIGGAMQTMGTAVFNGIGVLLMSAITLQDEFPQAVNNIVNMITSGGILDIANTVMTSLMNAVTSIQAAMPQILASINVLIQTVLQFIINNAPFIIQSLATMIVQLVQSIASPENITLIVQAVVVLFTSLVNAFTTIAPVLLEAFFAILVELINQFSNPATINQTINQVVNFIVRMAELLIQNLPTIITAMVTLLDRLISKITEPDTMSKLINATIDIIVAIATALIDNLPTVINAMLRLTTALIRELTKPETINKLMDAGLQLIKALVEALGETIGDIIEAGADIVRGIWDGITNMGGWIAEKVRGFISEKITGPIKDALKINSPSRVMMELGGFVSEGLADGIEDGGKDVETAAQRIANSVEEVFKNMSADINSIESTFTARGVISGSAGYTGQSSGFSEITPVGRRQSPGVIIEQHNTVNTELDMDRVNRDLSWELSRR